MLVRATALMNLKNTKPSEGSQTRKVMRCMLSFMRTVQNRSIHKGGIDGGQELWGGALGRNYFAGKKMFRRYIKVMVAQHRECTKCH